MKRSNSCSGECANNDPRLDETWNTTTITNSLGGHAKFDWKTYEEAAKETYFDVSRQHPREAVECYAWYKPKDVAKQSGTVLRLLLREARQSRGRNLLIGTGLLALAMVIVVLVSRRDPESRMHLGSTGTVVAGIIPFSLIPGIAFYTALTTVSCFDVCAVASQPSRCSSQGRGRRLVRLDMNLDLIPTPAIADSLLAAILLPVLVVLLSHGVWKVQSPGRRFVVAALASLAAWMVLVLSRDSLDAVDVLAGALLLAAALLAGFTLWTLIAWGFTVSMLQTLARSDAPLTQEAWMTAYTGGRPLEALTQDRLGVLFRLGLARREVDMVVMTPVRGGWMATAAALLRRFFGLKA